MLKRSTSICSLTWKERLGRMTVKIGCGSPQPYEMTYGLFTIK